MDTIQVLLLAPRSEGARAVANLLSDQSDMEVSEAPSSRGVELLSRVRRTEADVLVVESRPAGTASLCAQVLGEYPHLVILAIDPDDGTIALNRCKVESLSLPPLPLESLPDEIREAIE